MWQPDVVVYHAPCTDGFMSALLLERFYKDSSIQFIKGNFSDPDLLNKVSEASRDKRLMLVDFTFKADEMEHLHTLASHIVVLDHHDTAEREFQKLRGKVAVMDTRHKAFSQKVHVPSGKMHVFFDMQHSGASLTFAFLYGLSSKLPEPLEYVKLIDLHTYNRKGKDEADRILNFRCWTHRLSTHLDTFSEEERLDLHSIMLREKVPNNLIAEGAAIKGYVDAKVEAAVAESRQIGFVQPHTEDGDSDIFIKIAFSDYAFASDVANKLKDTSPSGIGACMYLTKNGIGFSLRSVKGVACNKLAELFGGGGHPQAAGLNVDYNKIQETLESFAWYSTE